jgi:triacylglycerol lipase
VPGFFGFTNWGELRYFGHVQTALQAAAAARGLPVAVHVVASEPTSSLPRRAALLAAAIAETAAADDAPLHLVGHSSGGLDARLLVSPGVTLPSELDVERLAARVRTVVTVSTPHAGTPLAAFFTGLLGQRLLSLLSVATIAALRFGHLPLGVLLELARVITLVRGGQPSTTLLDGLLGELMADFSPDRRAALSAFLQQIERDNALLPQLTPDGMDVFNAATGNRPGVDYACVVSQARRPGLGSTLAAGLDPAAQATHAVYAALHQLAGRTDAARLPRPTRAQAEVLRGAYEALPDAHASDGIVPTGSQLWGDVVFAARADHLDVLGHFGDATRTPPHVDWLVSGSGFDRAAFDALWDAVVRRLAA